MSRGGAGRATGAALGALLVLGVAAGCSTEEEGNPTPAPTSTSGTTSVPPPTAGTLPPGTPVPETVSPSSGVPAPSSGLPIPIPSSAEN